MTEKIFVLGLEWDSLSIAQKIQNAFIEKNFTTRSGQTLTTQEIVLGFSDDGQSGFVVEGFDCVRKFGLVVQISNDKKWISMYGGPYTDDQKTEVKYNGEFTDLTEASKTFEKILDDYERFKN